jgi:hypothetical protein
MPGLACLLPGWLFLTGAIAWAYEEIPVTDGGTITGNVSIAAGKPFKFQPQMIEARDCQFLRFATVLQDRAEVVIMNRAPVMHDIQAYEASHLDTRAWFNTPLPMNPHDKRNVRADSHEHLAGQPLKEIIHMTKGGSSS